mmetsp:Transcript_26515/g.67388  ORF Transcript_26515/g.67388 Transcript_26515/m.67388 type:complete len:426 (-) Transcript_26515:705-1982(-)
MQAPDPIQHDSGSDSIAAMIFMFDAFERFVEAGGTVTRTMLNDWKKMIAMSSRLGVYEILPPVAWLHSRRPVHRFVGALLSAALRPRLTADEVAAVSAAISWARCARFVNNWVIQNHEGQIRHLLSPEAAALDLRDANICQLVGVVRAFNSAEGAAARRKAHHAMCSDALLDAFHTPLLFSFLDPLMLIGKSRSGQNRPRPLGIAAMLITLMSKRPSATACWSDALRTEVHESIATLRNTLQWKQVAVPALDIMVSEIMFESMIANAVWGTEAAESSCTAASSASAPSGRFTFTSPPSPTPSAEAAPVDTRRLSQRDSPINMALKALSEGSVRGMDTDENCEMVCSLSEASYTTHASATAPAMGTACTESEMRLSETSESCAHDPNGHAMRHAMGHAMLSGEDLLQLIDEGEASKHGFFLYIGVR